MPHNVFNNGRVHVCAEMCPTCVFRPGNLMQLHPGRVREMVDQSKANQSTIVCHATLGKPQQAACRGFFDRYPTQPLQIAERLGLIAYIDPRRNHMADLKFTVEVRDYEDGGDNTLTIDSIEEAVREILDQGACDGIVIVTAAT